MRLHTLAASLLALTAAPLGAQNVTLPVGRYAEYAAAADAGALDPRTPDNRSLVERGIGFVPRVMETHTGYVMAGSGAAEVYFPVPFGWRAFDDGRKTFAFAPGTEATLVLGLVMREGEWDAWRQSLWAQIGGPEYEGVQRVQGADGAFGYLQRRAQGEDGEVFATATVFLRHPRHPDAALRVNLTAPPARFDHYLGLLGLVVRDTRAP